MSLEKLVECTLTLDSLLQTSVVTHIVDGDDDLVGILLLALGWVPRVSQVR